MVLAQEILQLEAALRREKAAPEVLMYEGELLESILFQIEERQKALNIDPQTPEEQFTGALYQMDLDRVKYLISSYLRSRLIKIQTFVVWIINNDKTELLSPQEFEFLGKYYAIKTNHYKKSFLFSIPEQFRKISKDPGQKTPIVQPDLDRHVFIKALENIGRVQTGDANDILLETGDIYLMQYNLAKSLFEESKIDLI